MKYIKEIPVNKDYDVIVVGGGPAGATAAASAAREGAKTLLIEQTGALGGMGTSALVPAWTPFSDQEKVIYKGMAEFVFEETKKGMKHIDPKATNWVAIDAEKLKRVYDDLVTSYGVDVLFVSFVSDVVVENNEIKSVIVSNKAGLTAYEAKVFVDTTGDADLVAFAGAPFSKGDDMGGELQPGTHCFVFSNVDMYGFNSIGRLNPSNPNSIVHRMIDDNKYPIFNMDKHVIGVIVGPGTVGFNAGHFNVDNTDPVSVSKAYMHGRKMAHTFRDALAEYGPEAFGNAHLVMTGSLVGVRETRRIIGDYVLTVDDYANRQTFEDEVCRNCYYIDVHASSAAAEAKGKLAKYGKGESHGIPYRSLIPKLKNVLVAGRSISCERMVQGSVRVMPVCLAMGEAAGMAAAHAVKFDGDVRKVDVKNLRKRLLEEGVYIK